MDARSESQPSAREILARDRQVGRQLVAYAFKKTRTAARATEAAQEAIARVLEGRGFCRWDPERKSLLNHLSDVVDSIVGNESQRASGRRERRMAEGDEERQPDSTPSAEDQIGAREDLARKQRLAARVMERVAKDAILTGMLEHQRAGVDAASELAALLRCTVKDIYRARERLAYHRDQVLAQEREGDEKRVKKQVVSP